MSAKFNIEEYLAKSRKVVQELGNFYPDNFGMVFGVDLAENMLYVVRVNSVLPKAYDERLNNGDPDYRRMVLAYVLSNVRRDEQEKLIQSIMPERLQVYFRNHDVFSYDFHEIRTGKWMFNHMEIRKLENSCVDVILGLYENAPEPVAEHDYKIGSNQVFITEDHDDASVDQLEELLSPDFSVVRVAEKESMDVLRRLIQEISLVICGIDNAENILKLVKRMDKHSDIPVVVIAEDGDDEAFTGLLEKGASDVVVKPFTARTVVNRVKNLVMLRDSSSMLRKLAVDPVTGFATGEFYYQKVDDILLANPQTEYNLVVFNIENYATLNDQYGSAMGDLIVEHIASYITDNIPGIVARGILPNGDLSILREITENVDKDAFHESIRNHGPVPNLVVKTGIVPVDKALGCKMLCERAHTIIESIKHEYGVYYGVYDLPMHEKVLREQRIFVGMEDALEMHQFKVFYQPKHASFDGKLAGCEALVRWQHPEYGMISPGEFMPIFEKFGFIRSMDSYVIKQVFSDIKCRLDEGKPVLPISINLSRRDFENGDLAEWIISLADSKGIDHRLVHFEVTESAFADNPKRMAATLKELHDAGFMIELDDFGAGFSSLTMLNSVELDVLKIDRSIIVNDVPGSEKNVLEFCMQLARMMNLKTVGEGVETEDQRLRLKYLGCNFIQGFYYSRPLPADQFYEYMEQHL